MDTEQLKLFLLALPVFFSHLVPGSHADNIRSIIYLCNPLIALSRPEEFRRRRRGCRAGLKRRARRRRYKPFLPSAIVENVKSVPVRWMSLSHWPRPSRNTMNETMSRSPCKCQGCIQFHPLTSLCLDNTIPTKTVWCFQNYKPCEYQRWRSQSTGTWCLALLGGTTYSRTWPKPRRWSQTSGEQT